MTPPAIDRDVLQRRLRAIDDLVRDLDEDRADVTAERLALDRRLRHAIERVLMALVDVATAVNAHVLASTTTRSPADARAGFAAMAELGVIEGATALELAASVGLRNVLAHAYVETDLAVVAEAVPRAADAYGAYRRQVARWLISG